MSEEKRCAQCGAALTADAPHGLCPACLLKRGFVSSTGAGESVNEGARTEFVPPTPAELAQHFPELEILGLIGRGGMGVVYKARQKRLDRLVALKILPGNVSRDPAFAERFQREAKALARLTHPNIVTVHDFGQTDGLFYFVMEFVDGMNLRQLLDTGKISPKEALAIVPQICDALQYAHDKGIVHRDIKPENILLAKDGTVKIADFGLAKLVGVEAKDLTITSARDVIGTPLYMAPEQVEHPQEVDHRADIYSLGVVFYQMLTGELPIGRFAPPSRKVHIDVRLDEVVLRALEKEPERRFQHASDVKTQVETIAQTSPMASAPPVAASSTPEASARDYSLNISHCLNRGWNLVISDFWRIVGVSALVWLLAWLATSSMVGIIIRYPLLGGLWLYFLNRIRGNRVTVDTAFSGFKVAFLQLVLAGLITKVLTILGLVCLILPGVYLWVVWTFAVALVVDKHLDFWPAMGLSRKMISKHWWKFFWFLIVLALIHLVGLMVCFVGVFVAVPVCLAALAYAYEDIFGPAAVTAAVATTAPATNARASTGTGRLIRVVGQFVTAGVALLFACLVVLLAMSSEAISSQAWSWFRPGLEVFAGIASVGFLFLVYRAVTTRTPEARQLAKSLVPWMAVLVLGILFGFWSPHLLKRPPPPPPPPPPVKAEAGGKFGEPYGQPSSMIGRLLTGDEVWQDFSQTVPLTAEGSLRLDNVNGRIEISGWDRNEVAIKAVKHGDTKENVDATQIEVEARPDRVVIHTRQPEAGLRSWFFWWRRNDVSVDYTIQVPQRARLERVESVNGSIAIDDVSGGIQAETVNGGIQSQNTAGNLKLSTVNGRIAAELGSGNQSVSLETVNGRIVATLPEGANAAVSADTVNGRITSDFSSLVVEKEFPLGSHLRGTLGNGGGRVKASTVNGRIEIRRGEPATGNIDLPFVNDPQVVGEWDSVDFVANPSDFDPDQTQWTGVLSLKGLTFLENGRTPQPWWTWTKGILIHRGDRTASHYEIREINGQSYLFLEWKGGDVTIRGMKPKYYVLRRKQPTDAPSNSSAASAPFVARYRGGTVELVALTSKPWTNGICWRADGTVSKGPFPAMNGSLDQWAANMLVDKIAFLIHTGEATDISAPVSRVNEESGVQLASRAWQAPYTRWPDGLFIQVITCPSNASVMNISLGIADGPWETAVTMSNSASALSQAVARGEWNASYDAVVGNQGDVAVSFVYPKVEDWETRMVYYASGDGGITPIRENLATAVKSPAAGTLLISSNEFARIKEFRLQRRKYQWVEFRNVSLQPGHATTVEIQDSGDEKESRVEAQNLSFGPVIERTIKLASESTANDYFLDLATGNFVDAPQNIRTLVKTRFTAGRVEGADNLIQAWARDSGADLMIGMTTPTAMPALWGGVIAIDPSLSFEKLTADEVLLRAAEADKELRQSGKPIPPFILFQSDAAVVFRTREGSTGVLQVVGLTDDQRAVKIRYKLVQNGATSGITSQNRDVESEPPVLRFVAWQDEWKTNQPGAARHPDGSPVTDAAELSWLREVHPAGMDASKLPLDSEPRFLHLSFSHPLFDETTLNEVTLLDDKGDPIPLAAHGSTAGSSQSANESNGQLGWLMETLGPGAGTNIPTRVTVRLRYTVGPLERTQEVSKTYHNGLLTLEGGSQLNGIGQNADGKAFVAIAEDTAALRTRQFDVIAVANDGREIRHGGWGRFGAVDKGVRVENFDFAIPLSDVAKFIIGTRPIRANEWRDVVLPEN